MNLKALIIVAGAMALAASPVHARNKGNAAFSGVPTQSMIEVTAQGEYFYQKCNHMYPMPKTLARNTIMKRMLSQRIGVYAMVVAVGETTAVLDNYMRSQMGGRTTFTREMCKLVATDLEKDLKGM